VKSIYKAISNWWFGFEGTLIYCPKCKSPKVKFGEITYLKGMAKDVETYPVYCNNCGATGEISETWNK